MKKAVKVILIVLAVLITLAAVAFVGAYTIQNRQLDQLTFEDIDMSKVQDGTYVGESRTILVKAEVEVKVEDHKIQSIKILRHDTLRGKKAEVITDTMVTTNTYEVDAVSGATASSKIIKNAVNNALAKGLVQ